MNKQLSIVVACYNSEGSIERSLNSVLDCSHDIVLIDDGSTDGTLEILKRYSQRYGMRLWLNQYHEGLAVCLNRAILQLKTTFIAVHGDRDISKPDRFQTQLDEIESDQSAGLVGTHVTKIDDNDNIIGHISYPPYSPSSIYACIMQSKLPPVLDQTIMLNRQKVLDVGGFNSSFSLCTFDLVCRLLSAGVKVTNMQNPLVFSRIPRISKEDRIQREYECETISAQFAQRSYKPTKVDDAYFLQDCFSEWVYNQSEG